MSSKIRVIELFAGVGGFRLGLEGWNGKSSSSNYEMPLRSKYEVVWSNQWEPSTKRQHANEVYSRRWSSSSHFGEDLNSVASPDFSDKVVDQNIPDHDLLVGGFPCQDYSVAGVNTKGIQGKKGVLWWNIHKILKAKRPPYVLLENVDRLLKSPTSQRGRDYAILLKTMAELGYSVEWRVINAAEYGMPQRRRRVFILGYHKSAAVKIDDLNAWRKSEGVLAKAFPADFGHFVDEQLELKGLASELSDSYDQGLFANSGVMSKGRVLMSKYTPICVDPEEYSVFHTLRDVLIEDSGKIPAEFFISEDRKLKSPLVKRQKIGAELSYLDVSNESEVVL
jgi:DNA (cytosine-5)-methyltransferase 1